MNVLNEGQTTRVQYNQYNLSYNGLSMIGRSVRRCSYVSFECHGDLSSRGREGLEQQQRGHAICRQLRRGEGKSIMEGPESFNK